MNDRDQRMHLFYKMEEVANVVVELREEVRNATDEHASMTGHMEADLQRHSEECLRARQLEQQAVERERSKGNATVTVVLAIIGIVSSIALAIVSWLWATMGG
jgi:hypothetical protein